MMRIQGNWLERAETQAVFSALSEFETYAVGGCVRNALLDAPISDVDISTLARPTEIEAAAVKAGLKSVPTGIDHGTITVISSGVPYEVTTFRRDVATDGRRAVVEFADCIEEDALRRDFTMNALYARKDGTVIDPLGGLRDLQSRRVRFIEDASQRIQEDYLRILRFFRFHAWYGDIDAGIDTEGLAACASNLGGLETLSKERIGSELFKLLAAPDPGQALASMEATGILSCILPGARSSDVAVLVHLEAGEEPDPIRRLAALGGEDAKANLRLSNSNANDVTIIRDAAVDGLPIAEAAYRFGFKRGKDVVLVRFALMSEPLPNDLEALLEEGANAVFPIKAKDLPEFEGAELGAMLKNLEKRWIKSGFALSKLALLSRT